MSLSDILKLLEFLKKNKLTHYGVFILVIGLFYFYQFMPLQKQVSHIEEIQTQYILDIGSKDSKEKRRIYSTLRQTMLRGQTSFYEKYKTYIFDGTTVRNFDDKTIDDMVNDIYKIILVVKDEMQVDLAKKGLYPRQIEYLAKASQIVTKGLTFARITKICKLVKAGKDYETVETLSRSFHREIIDATENALRNEVFKIL